MEGVGECVADILPPSRHIFHTMWGSVDPDERCAELRSWLFQLRDAQAHLTRHHPEGSVRAFCDCLEHNLRHAAHAT